MPQANNDGLSIHYEVEGEGPPLVMHHGSFGSLDDWRDFGYSDALKDRHQLILMDSRGHGKSGKPHDPAMYGLASRASDVIAVLDDLGSRKADFMGYSMGGWIGFGLAKYGPQSLPFPHFGRRAPVPGKHAGVQSNVAQRIKCVPGACWNPPSASILSRRYGNEWSPTTSMPCMR